MYTHLLTWSAQVLLLVAGGALVAMTLANAKARLIFWQVLLLALLLLPAIEPWQSTPVVVVKIAPAAVMPFEAGMDITRPGLHWRPQYWLLAIAAGAALRLIWIAAGFLRLRRYRIRATPLTEPPFLFATTSARWYVSGTLPGPVTYGWLQPLILLPARVMELPLPLRQAIACHELVHVRRRDWLFVLAEEAVRSLLWFHPAVWYVLSRIQLAREQVVDSEVVRLTQDRDCYLDALVEVAAQKLQPDPGGLFQVAAPLFLRKRHLAVRVAAVLKEVSMSKSRIAARLTAAFSAMFAAARVAIWFVPFVSPAQTILDDPGIAVDAGATLLHRAPVHHPAGATGVVTLEASLNAKGEVTDAHVLSGPDDLRKEALTSVLQWHYNPGLSRVQISMRFDPTGPAVPSTPAATPAPRATVAADRPLPTPGPNPRITSIEFIGFSPEGERQLRDRLPIREGDTTTPAEMTGVATAVREFDSHAVLSFAQRRAADGTPGMVARIRVTTPPVVELPTVAAISAPAPVPLPPGVYRIGNGVTPPRAVFAPSPEYSDEARKAKYQGSVALSAVIDESGQPTNVVVIRSLGMGLDEKAIEALQKWHFNPGMKDGVPVKVQASIEINFRLL